MYEYIHVKAHLGGFFTEANHRQIIEEHVKKGWRLVQVLPMGYNGNGKPTEYEIIFEKRVEGN